MTRAGGVVLAFLIAGVARADLTLVTAVTLDGAPPALREAAGLAPGRCLMTLRYQGSRMRTEEAGGAVTIDDLATGDRYRLDLERHTYTVVAAEPPALSTAWTDRLALQTRTALSSLAGERVLAGRRATGQRFVATIRLHLRGADRDLGRIEIEGERWSVSDVTLPGGAAAALLARLPLLGGVAQSALTARLAAQSGTPLALRMRLRVVSAVGDLGGLLPRAPIDARAEVLSLSEAALPEALFQVPPGFRQEGALRTDGQEAAPPPAPPSGSLRRSGSPR